MAAETVLKSTYMDDSMDSVVDESQGIKLYEELNQLWSKAGMQAHKWLSNSTKVLERIPVESRASEVHIASDGLPMVKTLGVTWLPGEDVFTFNANPPEKDFLLTKRNFLKKIVKLFDPVGFLAPFIIRAKILLQEMWAAGMDWDDLFLGDLASKARKWFKELEDLPTIKVPRCLRLGQEEETLVSGRSGLQQTQNSGVNSLKDLVSVLPDSPYQLRRNNNGILLESPRLRTKKALGDRALSMAAPFLWNSLPLPIRQETSIDSFKRSVKTYLFKKAFS